MPNQFFPPKVVRFNYLIDASSLLGFNSFEGGVAAPMLKRGWIQNGENESCGCRLGQKRYW